MSPYHLANSEPVCSPQSLTIWGRKWPKQKVYIPKPSTDDVRKSLMNRHESLVNVSKQIIHGLSEYRLKYHLFLPSYLVDTQNQYLG